MPFVRLHAMFEDESDRTVASLASVYGNRSALTDAMRRITMEHLSRESLAGKSILLKPNWVLHNRSQTDHLCLRTNDEFVLAALQIVLELSPKTVTIGDAPVQGCDWSRVVTPVFLTEVNRLSQAYSVPVMISDFRRVTFDPKQNVVLKNRRDLDEYTIFDLGPQSALESITSKEARFRVVDYDAKRLAHSHAVGMHKYCITKEFFDADVVISLPKIKTHQKTGITGALKNLVGINGDKDFLPHHRVGGTGEGGDCYPGKNPLRRLSEWALDRANEFQGRHIYWGFRALASLCWRMSRPSPVQNLGAAWHGNDTCWRMVVDLNRIAEFGRVEGTVTDVRQRTLYSLCDGIVGGQGDGPLNPEPLPLGMIAFSDDSSVTDICFGTLMGFDIEKIPLLKYAARAISKTKLQLSLNGRAVELADLVRLAVPTKPPPGWQSHLGYSLTNSISESMANSAR